MSQLGHLTHQDLWLYFVKVSLVWIYILLMVCFMDLKAMTLP